MMFTAAPVVSKADWSTNVLKPSEDQSNEDPKFTSEDRVNFYSDNAALYDADMVTYEFKGPQVAAEEAHAALNGNFEAKILDVGCGTGKVLEDMLKFGPYKNADGLEPAKGMLDIAQHKGLYQVYLNKFLYLDCGLEHDKYDAVVSSGTFVAGHMKSDCLIELCNVVKSGGFIVITMRDEHLSTVDEYKNNLRPTIEKLISEGRWKVVKDETFPGWCFSKDGKGIDGRLFVFEKL